MGESRRDLLIVGAGPAGLAAAYRAAKSGLLVTVVDDNPAAGGQIWRGEQRKSTSAEARAWFEKVRSVDIQFVEGARVFQQRQTEREAVLLQRPAVVSARQAAGDDEQLRRHARRPDQAQQAVVLLRI